MRIAMWSGPRNLSTAMMYAFGARDDFAVWDEPVAQPCPAYPETNASMRAYLARLASLRFCTS